MENKQSNTLAVVGLILGIVSIVFPWIPYIGFLALPAGIVGIILSAKGRKVPTGKGMATAGLVLSIIGVVLSGIVVLCAICAIGTVGCAAALQ